MIVRYDGTEKFDIEIKSEWLLICFTVVMKSPGQLIQLKFRKALVTRNVLHPVSLKCGMACNAESSGAMV